MQVSIFYSETDGTLPRVTSGVLHANLEEASMSAQVERLVELDDDFSAYNPIIKFLLVGESGTCSDISTLGATEGNIHVSVVRQRESDRLVNYCSTFKTSGKFRFESLALQQGHSLRYVVERNGVKGYSRVLGGDEVEGDHEILLEFAPRIDEEQATIPPSKVRDLGFTSQVNVSALFGDLTIEDITNTEKTSLSVWRPFATGQDRSSYLENAKLKEAVRCGIPFGRRSEVYRDVLEIKAASFAYSSALKSAFKVEEPEAFDPRYPPHFEGSLENLSQRFGLNTNGIRHAKHVLCALADCEPDVMCCPLMVPTVALMLLNLQPHDVFCGVKQLIAHSRHKQMIQKRLFFFRLNQKEHFGQAVIGAELIRRRHSRIATVFARVNLPLNSICATMLSQFFTNVLPIPCTTRILDAFINEGHKVLIRYILAIIKHLELQLLNCETADEVSALFDASNPSGCKKSITPQQFTVLANNAFNISLGRQELDEIDVAMSAQSEALAMHANTDPFPACLRFYPPVIPSSSVADSQLMQALFLWSGGGRTKWNRVYSATNDGWSISTLYRLADECEGSVATSFDHPKCVLLVDSVGLADGKSTRTVFGAALSALPNSPSSHYRGDESSFVFTKDKTFKSTGMNKYFLLCESDHLTIGGGSKGPALRLESDLQRGTSYACDTFDSPAFTTNSEGILDVLEVELYAITS